MDAIAFSDEVEGFAQDLDTTVSRQPPISRFEAMAGDSKLVFGRACILRPLLNAVSASLFEAQTGLNALWTEEAIHRAYYITQLVCRLERDCPLSTCDHLALEETIALDLASRFRSLVCRDGHKSVPCSATLDGVIRNTVALFGPTVGRISVDTRLDYISLSANQHRALTLAACQLVCNAIRHAFHGKRNGRIEVVLERHSKLAASLLVVDDGTFSTDNSYHADCGALSGLPAILGADVRYAQSHTGGTCVRVRFSLCR